MLSLRKPESEKIYQDKPKKEGCFLCDRDLLLKEYEHWILVENKYPYDLIASKHDLIATKRHIKGHDNLTIAEIAELNKIRNETNYDLEMFNKPIRQSHNTHFHIHFIKFI